MFGNASKQICKYSLEKCNGIFENDAFFVTFFAKIIIFILILVLIIP